MGDFLRGLLAHLDFLRFRYEVELLMAGCRISDTSAKQENQERQQNCAEHGSRLRPHNAIGSEQLSFQLCWNVERLRSRFSPSGIALFATDRWRITRFSHRERSLVLEVVGKQNQLAVDQPVTPL